jgi:hypothetical protein
MVRKIHKNAAAALLGDLVLKLALTAAPFAVSLLGVI